MFKNKQLNDQLKTLSENLTLEKLAREKWIERYDLEHKKFSELTDENIANKMTIKDQDMKIDGLNLLIEKLQKSIETIQVKYNEVLKNFHEKQNQLETVNRNLGSTKALLSTIESEHQK